MPRPSPPDSQELDQLHSRATLGAKAPISIRLGREQVVAAEKSVGYQTQLRMWIAAGIRPEGTCH